MKEISLKLGPYRLSAKPGALVLPAIIFGFALYQYLYVKHLPNSKTNLVLIQPVFILLTLFTLWVLFQNIKVAKKGQGEETPLNRASGQEHGRKQLKRFLLITGLYVVAIPILGFVISNLAFLSICMIFLQEKRRKLIVVIALAATAAVYLLFEVWIQAPLPKGFWVYLR